MVSGGGGGKTHLCDGVAVLACATCSFVLLLAWLCFFTRGDFAALRRVRFSPQHVFILYARLFVSWCRSTQEQLFISGSGLLPHLVKEITSNGMWCAGSLQTAFDLLGELCKGNREVRRESRSRPRYLDLDRRPVGASASGAAAAARGPSCGLGIWPFSCGLFLSPPVHFRTLNSISCRCAAFLWEP